MPAGLGNHKKACKKRHEDKAQELQFLAGITAQAQSASCMLETAVRVITISLGSLPAPRFIAPWERDTHAGQLPADDTPGSARWVLIYNFSGCLANPSGQQLTTAMTPLIWTQLWAAVFAQLRVIRITTSELNIIQTVVMESKPSNLMSTASQFKILTQWWNLSHGCHFGQEKILNLLRLHWRLEWQGNRWMQW